MAIVESLEEESTIFFSISANSERGGRQRKKGMKNFVVKEAIFKSDSNYSIMSRNSGVPRGRKKAVNREAPDTGLKRALCTLNGGSQNQQTEERGGRVQKKMIGNANRGGVRKSQENNAH